MVQKESPDHADSPKPPVVPVPVALYISNGLIFELYDGGQPRRNFAICWERLVPVNERGPEVPSQNPTSPSIENG
jgi:hypothetical protein